MLILKPQWLLVIMVVTFHRGVRCKLAYLQPYSGNAEQLLEYKKMLLQLLDDIEEKLIQWPASNHSSERTVNPTDDELHAVEKRSLANASLPVEYTQTEPSSTTASNETVSALDTTFIPLENATNGVTASTEPVQAEASTVAAHLANVELQSTTTEPAIITPNATSADSSTSTTTATTKEPMQRLEDGSMPSNSGAAPMPELLFNNTMGCEKWTQQRLIQLLKDRGTYNPDLMAWDVLGVQRFILKDSDSMYDSVETDEQQVTVDKNLEALEKMIGELELKNCALDTPEMRGRLYNITHGLRHYYRYKYNNQRRRRRQILDKLIGFNQLTYLYDRISKTPAHDDSSQQAGSSTTPPPLPTDPNEIGTVHIYDCHQRGSPEDGYLRMCGACRAVRVMPSRFFPPFINEVVCDSDNACLYFYDYPHGKCKQKHMNFVVLENVGSDECQIWKQFHLNVRVCCECFINELSFFSKYV